MYCSYCETDGCDLQPEVLLVTLIVFYIIGIIAQKIILKVEQSNRFIRSKRDEELEQEKEQQEQQDEQKQTGEQTDSDQEEP